MKVLNLYGMTFGKLVAIEPSGKDGKRIKWLCLCACGKQTQVRSSHLTANKVRSCGCLLVEAAGKLNKKHGMTHTRTYASWTSMNNRCNNSNAVGWGLWGGRGICVCKRWKDFMCFLEDMGPRPIGKSLDRINNDWHYTPDNCRWATPKEQAMNRRKQIKKGEKRILIVLPKLIEN